jgi:hypothetical protein
MIKIVRKAYIVGTNHKFQRGEQRQREFSSFLEKICINLDIQLVAEEINDNAKLIVARDITNKHGIKYLIIEPRPSQYEEYGIKPIHKIRYEVMQIFDLESLHDPIDISDKIARELDQRIVDLHSSPREKVWLSRIEMANLWPVLVICGANHVTSFFSLLTHNDVLTKVVEQHWGE